MLRRILPVVACAFLLYACQKEPDLTASGGSGGSPAGSSGDYYPTTTGNEWHYVSTINGAYTQKIPGVDSIIDGDKYTKIQASTTTVGSWLNKKNGIYTSFSRSMVQGIPVKFTILKDAAVGTKWSISVLSGAAVVRIDYTIVSRDGKKTVNGKEFSNVISTHYDEFVEFSPDMKIGEGTQYYAKGVGPILAVSSYDFGTSFTDSTYLTSYILK